MEWMATTAGDGHINDRIARDKEYLLSRKQILGLLSTTEELEKDRDSR
jgi:hypothetical protein